MGNNGRMNSLSRICLLLSVAAGLVFPAAAQATVINVDKTEDIYDPGDVGCSLRNAFLSADTDMQHADCETGMGDDVLKLRPGTYRLDLLGAGEPNGFMGDLDMIDDGGMVIKPATSTGKVVIDGNGTDRIFDHVGISAGVLTLRNLELTNGNPGTGGDGGLLRTANSEVRLEGVTLSSGTGDDGGAISVLGGRLSAVNSTFVNNHAVGSGGAIEAAVGSTLDLRNVTIADNEADLDRNSTGDGGGVKVSGAVSMTNSILANNTDSSPDPPDQFNDCFSGPGFFPRFLLTTADLGVDGCHVGFDPGTNKESFTVALGPLADNGGPVRTVAISPESPAVDSGGSVDPDKCPGTDQRGVLRPAGGCDLGAFEFDPDGVPPGPLPGLGKPTLNTAVLSNMKLEILVKCPAKFKPECISTLQAQKAKNGPAISSAAKVTVKSGRKRQVTLTVKSSFRDLVEAMTRVDRPGLAVRHRIRSKRVGGKKTKKASTLNLTLKVRIKN